MIDLHYNQSYHGDDPRTERPYRSGRNKRFKYAVHHQLGFVQSMVNLYIVLALILFQSYPGCHALISSTSKPTGKSYAMACIFRWLILNSSFPYLQPHQRCLSFIRYHLQSSVH